MEGVDPLRSHVCEMTLFVDNDRSCSSSYGPQVCVHLQSSHHVKKSARYHGGWVLVDSRVCILGLVRRHWEGVTRLGWGDTGYGGISLRSGGGALGVMVND